MESSSSIICNLCQDSFSTRTALQSHLVKSHSAFLANRTGKCVTKDRYRLPGQVLNGAHKKAMKKVSQVMRNGAIHDVNGSHGNNGSLGNRVSSDNEEPLPDRTLLHLDINPTPAIDTIKINHQNICSPDSTTDTFGITKTEPTTLAPGGKDSKDSLEDPHWYIGATDGETEEMDVSFQAENGRNRSVGEVDDNVSQGTDHIDLSSPFDSPVCQLSPRELLLEPSSTTSPGAPSVGNSPASIISIEDSPIAIPACPRVGTSPAFIADETSQPTTEEVDESMPLSRANQDATPDAGNNEREPDDPELLYGQYNDQYNDSDYNITKQRVDLDDQARRHSLSSASDLDGDTDTVLSNNQLVSTSRLRSQGVAPRKRVLLSSAVGLEGAAEKKLEFKKHELLVHDTPEKVRGLNVTPDKSTVDTPVKVPEDVFSVDDQGNV